MKPKSAKKRLVRRPFPIVGIGASAGGLAAFTQLLEHLPNDTGMAFVLVQHLDPDHESSLAQLLSRNTALPVRVVTTRLRVEPDHIYVIPPDRILSFADGTLILRPRPADRRLPHSIDVLFESLARDCKDRAIGVILSGSATDGTLGLEAIKAEGGITFAQDRTAKFDSMPRSAIAAGCVDFVLPPKAIAAELARIARHLSRLGRPAGEPEPAPGKVHLPPARRHAETKNSGFTDILVLLRDRLGVDFSAYKPSTIQRRITRRMVLGRWGTMAAYARSLVKEPKELDLLFSDMLIGVTNFFRNAEAFDALAKKAFPGIVTPQRTEPVRVWVPGCSSGQEAYSIAMALVEYGERTTGRPPALHIFGTDLNEAALNKARLGLYPKNQLGDISAKRLQRFFVEEAGGYRISRSIRDACVFARHNLVGDSPFSRMDLVSCRNLLIYVEADLQNRILPTFHYALKPDGVLFLGTSETIGTLTELFEPIDKKQKIYRRKGAGPRLLPLHFNSRHPAAAKTVESAKPGTPVAGLSGEFLAQREADRLALNQYAPPGVLVDSTLRIIQFRGATGPYLEPPTGKADFHLFKMARAGLLAPLRSALAQARREQGPVRRKNVTLTGRGETRQVTLAITPLKNLREPCHLISFEDQSIRSFIAADRADAPPAVPVRGQARRVVALERELIEARDYVQSLQEQHEAAREEIQASSEELQSGYEELQSINEELETSTEELESTNEELITVNEEMLQRNEELIRLNSDLSNLNTSINTAIVVVGRDLTLWRFTAPAEKLFNLMPTDLGRSIRGIKHNIEIPRLETLLTGVMERGVMHEAEVQDSAGHWYLLRIRPYLGATRKITGAVLALVDIDALKRGELEIRTARDYAEATLRTARDPLVILQADLRVKTANEAFYRVFQTTPDQTEGRLIHQLGDRQWNQPRLRKLLAGVLPHDKSFKNFEVVFDYPVIGVRTMLLHGRQLVTKGPGPLILLSIEDVSERREARAALLRSETRYRRLFEAAKDGILILDPLTRKITDANPFISQFLGYTRAELVGKELWQIGLLKDEAASKAALRELKAKAFIRYEDLPLKTKGGQRREVEFVSNLYDEGGHQVIQCNIRDITGRKQAEKALQESEAQLNAVLERLPVGVSLTGRDGRTQLANSLMRHYMPDGLPSLDAGQTSRWRARGPDGSALPPEEWPAARALRGEVVIPGIEFIFVENDGRETWVTKASAPLRNGDGAVIGAVVMIQDIDVRKRGEGALLAAIEELKLAQLAAARASRAKNDFLAALSHELRTPLTPVLLNAAALREDDRLPADVRDQLGMMERNIALEARLIDDLLDLTKISHDKLRLRAQPCDAHQLIDLAIEIVWEDARAKGIAIERVYTARHSGLVVDPARFQQILWNLLRNAVKFTPRNGRVCVTTRDLKPDRGQTWLRIEVADSGIGIEPARLEQIFMPFDQGGLSGDHRFGGVGLGLAIARAIVELHGGRISAQSDGPTHGSTLVVELPGSTDPQSPASPASATPADSPKAKATVTPLRLLLVEDHPHTLQVLDRLLQRDGHQVTAVTTVAEALIAAGAGSFDLVISDLGLPDGTGNSLMKRLHADHGLRGIALSGYGMEQEALPSLDSSFLTHLVKPVSIAELRRTIAAIPPASK